MPIFIADETQELLDSRDEEIESLHKKIDSLEEQLWECWQLLRSTKGRDDGS